MKWSLHLSYVCASFLLSGCSTPELPRVKKTEARLYLQGDPCSFDPRVGYDRRTQQVIRELFEGLTRIGKDGQPQLALAKSVRVSPDGTVYTFHLVGSLWSNGLEVVADDFVFAWKSSLDPNESAARSDALFVIYNARKARCGECPLDAVGVKALDKHTLEVTLEYPVPYFLELLANPVFSPLCRSVVEKDPSFATTQNFVSNGPFLLKERTLKSHIVLEKNPRYWNPDKPLLDRISFSILEDPQTAYNMFIAGCLDWYGDPCGGVSLEVAADLYQKKKLSFHNAGASYQLLCRTDAPHLRSSKIRRAIACAINRQSLCDNVLQGGEKPAFSLSPSSLTYLDTPPFEDNRPDKAAVLFEEGLFELSLTPETFPPVTISYWSDPSVKPMMEAIQSQIKAALHIDVRLEPLDRGTYLKKVFSGEYEVLNLSLNVWTHDPSSNLDLFKFKKTALNGTAWSDPEYTRLLDLAEATATPDDRRKYFKKAEECIMNQLPVIPICYQTFKYIKSPSLRGEALSPVGIMELKWLDKVD